MWLKIKKKLSNFFILVKIIFLKKNNIYPDKIFFYIPKEKLEFNIQINIKKINFFILNKDISINSFFLNGLWDKNKIDIKNYQKFNINYKSIYEIYVEKRKFYESSEYIFKSEIINSGKITSRGQKTLKDLKNYFISIDKLKKNIKKNGYISQKNLKTNNLSDEIGVVIGRNGEIIKLQDKFGGTHRFALCRIFKKKKVYISVKAIHYKFLDNNIKKKYKVNLDDKMLALYIKKKLERTCK
jgi:hypothetical protein